MLSAPFAFGRRRGGSKKNRVAISEAINDARLGGIVGRHLHLYSVTDRQTNKAFTHPAGDVRKNKALVRKRDAKHGPGKHRHDGALHFDGFFRIHDGIFSSRLRTARLTNSEAALRNQFRSYRRKPEKFRRPPPP